MKSSNCGTVFKVSTIVEVMIDMKEIIAIAYNSMPNLYNFFQRQLPLHRDLTVAYQKVSRSSFLVVPNHHPQSVQTPPPFLDPNQL